MYVSQEASHQKLWGRGATLMVALLGEIIGIHCGDVARPLPIK
jgi:hypothetical protein